MLDQQREEGSVVPLPEEDMAALFLLSREVLETSGYGQYEVSNFARSDNYRSRHNCKYWTLAPYVGLGPAAHSYHAPVRSWNHRDLDMYLETLAQGRLPVMEKETLTVNQQMIEAIYLGLRQIRGIPIADFNQRFPVDFRTLFEPVLSDRLLDKLLEPGADFCRLTPEGMLVMDTVVGRFVELIPI
ncbi:MAG: hypothetical protein GY697_15215 [Desulfobacterales bacterium]|nr:hypothetical protein [Desulfobacterales bacterium]